MQQGEECWFIRLQSDGRLVVKLRDGEQVLQIHGITVPQPLPDSYIETFQQLARLAKPLYCIIKAGYPDNDIHARIDYFGWRDKTGDVWQDLAILLIEKGIVKVSEDDFPEKEKYLMHARLAK